MKREKWKQHPLYSANTKPQLDVMCKNLRIPVKPSMTKHHLLQLICDKQGQTQPELPTLYNGDLSKVPSSLSELHKLTVGKLRAILKHHNYAFTGTKDQLVLQVSLIRQGKQHMVLYPEEQEIKNLVEISKKLTLAQRELGLSMHTYHKRTHTIQTNASFLGVPTDIKTEADLEHIFDPLIHYIEQTIQTRKHRDDAMQFLPSKATTGGDK